MTHFYWKLNESANAILEALIMSLDLKAEEAESVRLLQTGHYNQLRLLHYPPMSRDMLENGKYGRIAAHRDFRWAMHSF
jgi:isopenicillin N synthase-like dioxygenase